MTDKEKLEAVRAEIHRLVDVRGYDREMANDLFTFMDSLPNEPVSEVWHDAQTEQPQAKEKILATNEYGDCEIDFAINMALYWPKVIKWAYIEDLLNLSNVERIEKNCKEEPVSKVWHDMSEEAENGRSTIIIDPKGFYGAVLRKGGSQLRNHNKERYVKWAYIDDIINITNKEEPVSGDLEEASKEWLKPQLDKSYADYGEVKMMELTHFDGYAMLDAIEFGAKWQKQNLWKSAEGSDLPIFDREVIVLTQSYPLKDSEYAVYFAHRPDPKGWDGKSITTGKVEHYTPKTYGKGGWNIPDVIFWLDVKLPKRD